MQRKTTSGIKWILIPLFLFGVSYIVVGMMKIVLATLTVAAPSPGLLMLADFFYGATSIAFFISLFGVPFGLYTIISEHPKVLGKHVHRSLWIVSLVILVLYVGYQGYRRSEMKLITIGDDSSKISETAEDKAAIGLNKKRHFWVNEEQVDFWMTETIAKLDPQRKDPSGWGINVRHGTFMHPNEALDHAIVSFSSEGFEKPQGLLVIKGNALVNSFYIPHWHPPAHIDNIKWTTDTVATYDMTTYYNGKVTVGYIDTEKDVMGLELVNDF